MPIVAPRALDAIAAEGQQSLARIRDEAQRLRDLGTEAKEKIEATAKHAEVALGQIFEGIGQIFETGAKSVCEKLDELEKGVRSKAAVTPIIKDGNPK